jgi:hypothetical protein
LLQIVFEPFTIFCAAALLLIFTCLTWIDAISPPDKVDISFEQVEHKDRSGSGLSALQPNPAWTPVETKTSPAGGVDRQ